MTPTGQPANRASRPARPEPAPVVARFRLRYAKRGAMRFASHRDFQRSFERAVRRAGVPVGLSAGFTQHPRISYAGAAPTGAASEAEYLEIGLTEAVPPDRLAGALDAALPPGLHVLAAVVADGVPLADRLQASHWRVRLPGATPAQAAAAVTAFLQADRVPVDRVTRDGRRTLDVRAAVRRVDVRAGETAGGGPCAILDLVVRHVTPVVRPDDVVTGLRQFSGFAPPVPPVATRLAQGPMRDDGWVADPFPGESDPPAGPAAPTDHPR